ncbi:trypsin-like serine peptidase [Streptomyces sp. NPDC018693]|uniref:trypsin-like serine peptidase n=1 Tax=unclassified Streptomyces TaxID=2593676 RepID=UPI0037B35756
MLRPSASPPGHRLLRGRRGDHARRNGERENGVTGRAAVAGAGQTLDPVGKILFNYAGGSPSSCTGTVVNTPAETLGITAGHCLYSDGGWHRNIAFVPAYDGTSPLGVFTAWNIAVDSLWSAETDEEHDYGVIITNDNSAGETAADAAGA